MPAQTTITLRQGIASAWTSADPVLALGELGLNTTDSTIKIGDNVNSWTHISSYVPHTSAQNTFLKGQVITLNPTNPATVGLDVTGTMRWGRPTAAQINTGGTSITYTYDYSSSGSNIYPIQVGDYVTTSGFTDTNYNISNKVVTSITTAYPLATFTVSIPSGPPPGSATIPNNGSCWFYETTTNMPDIAKWSYVGPGGGPGSTATTIAARVTSNGTFTVSGSLNRAILGGGGTTGASFDNNGNLIRTTSSERYKQDIADATYAYEDVLALAPKTFRLRSEVLENEDARTYGGLIAEDVDKIDSLKVFVNYTKNEDGETIPDGLQYGELVSALVSAIKYQDSLITDLVSRVVTLEKKSK
jgi:hypothetical protein